MHCSVCGYNPDDHYDGLHPDDKLQKFLHHIRYQANKIKDSAHIKALDKEVSVMMLICKD